MAIVHTVSQAFIVKEDYETIIDMWNDDDTKFIHLSKLIKLKNSEEEQRYCPIAIDCDMIVAVQG